MSIKIVCLMKRKAGMSPEAFRAHYESKHAPLAMKLLPFFSDYRRNYLLRDMAYKPKHLNDLPPMPDCDVVTEITFASREDYEGMLAALADSKIGAEIAADEENFLDRTSMTMFVVDEVKTAPEALAVLRAVR